MAPLFPKATTASTPGLFKAPDTKGGIFGETTSKNDIFGSSNKLDLNQVDDLRLLAEQQGFKEKKSLNAVQKVGRILNADIAAIAGGVRGAILKD